MFKQGKVCFKNFKWIEHDGLNLFVKFLAQEVLDNLKDRWYQADNPPPDLLLNEEEFLSFLHPEHSRGMLKFMVKEIIRDLGISFKNMVLGVVYLQTLGHCTVMG